MKNKILVQILTMLTGVLSSLCAHATVTYTTHDSNGKPIATFTEVQGPGSFGRAWQDPSGMLWSSYQGLFNNEALKPDQSDVIIDSPATEACAKIGGRLPSASDYNRFMTYFELDPRTQTQSAQGSKDFLVIFPFDASTDYGQDLWTSTPQPQPGCAYVFLYNGGVYPCFMVEDRRRDLEAVRCVSP